MPHDADVVIANGYGDCKDHATLFAALLQAKGIASEPVLINANNSYALPDAPTLAQFNHLITWIPELKRTRIPLPAWRRSARCRLSNTARRWFMA